MNDEVNAKSDEYITCPHCHMEFRLVDLEATLNKGHFKCHVCSKRFPSPLTQHQDRTPARKTNYRSWIYTVLVVLIAAVSSYFYFSASKLPAAPQSPSSMAPSPAPPRAPSVAGSPIDPSEKFQTIKRIAEEFNKNHTYTMEGEFVCIDMAISVWNQLMTSGINAKIYGGNVQEDVSEWNYNELVSRSNHAWVVAQISPTEKVAVETTAGKVFSSEMKLASAYFKGIAFDNPSQIKKWESLRKKASELCPEAQQMIDDWNNNVAGKQRRSEASIARQSRIEQRRQDCQNTINKLNEFKFRAIFRN